MVGLDVVMRALGFLAAARFVWVLRLCLAAAHRASLAIFPCVGCKEG